MKAASTFATRSPLMIRNPYRMYPPGVGQQTLATQALTRQLMGVSTRNGRPRRRRKKKAVAAPRRKGKGSRRPARLVKGSAAAKRYMASIRRKRKR